MRCSNPGLAHRVLSNKKYTKFIMLRASLFLTDYTQNPPVKGPLNRKVFRKDVSSLEGTTFLTTKKSFIYRRKKRKAKKK